MAKFVMKHRQEYTPSIRKYTNNNNNNIIEERKEVMTTSEKIEMVNSILDDQAQNKVNAKKIKKDRGLIERTESSKIVLTEDNKELLVD
jgi:hypothetical protein